MSFYSLTGWAGLNRIRCDLVHVYHIQENRVISSQGEGRGYKERVWRRKKVRRRQERKDRSTKKRSPEGRQNSLKIGVARLYIHHITLTAVRPVFLCPLLTPTGNTWAVKTEPGARYFQFNSKWWEHREGHREAGYGKDTRTTLRGSLVLLLHCRKQNYQCLVLKHSLFQCL